MAINKKLIHFKNEEAFNRELQAGNILETSICFVPDAKFIYTRGSYWYCPYSKEDIDQIISNTNTNSQKLIDDLESKLTPLINNKVDKEIGKSLVDDTLITKLSELDDQETINNSIQQVQSNLTDHLQNISNPHQVTKDQIGLSNVTNETQIPLSQKGQANGVAELDDAGKVPTSQLPSYVDDVLEYDNLTLFPSEGETGKIYVAKDTNLTYRWSGTSYVEISQSLAIGETSSTAYAGDKGKQLSDKVAEVYSTNSVINGLSNITFDSDNTEEQTLSADSSIKTWDGSGTLHDMKIPYASISKAGVMSAADKVKLDNSVSQEELTQLETRVESNEDKLAIIQGEETVDGSIKKALKDAKDYTNSSVSTKQDILVSSTNIKTVNGETILGEGNIEIIIPETVLSDSYAASTEVNEALEPKAKDTYEIAIGKLHKAILDNEEVTSTAFINFQTVLGVQNANQVMPDLADTNYLNGQTQFISALKALDSAIKVISDQASTITDLTDRVTALEDALNLKLVQE